MPAMRAGDLERSSTLVLGSWFLGLGPYQGLGPSLVLGPSPVLRSFGPSIRPWSFGPSSVLQSGFKATEHSTDRVALLDQPRRFRIVNVLPTVRHMEARAYL